jgi:hypothetical protein
MLLRIVWRPSAIACADTRTWRMMPAAGFPRGVQERPIREVAMMACWKRYSGFAIIVLSGLGVFACSQPEQTSPATTATTRAPRVEADKPFAPGGRITLQLASGSYDVRAAADGHIRVTLSGNIGDAKVDVTTGEGRAEVVVKDTPQNNFHAAIEVPKASDLVTHLTAGELTLAAITGNKDIESAAGNVTIDVADPNEYAEVDASLKAGNIDAAPFGGSRSGLLPHVTWSGQGKYTLHATLGAGNLVLRKS